MLEKELENFFEKILEIQNKIKDFYNIKMYPYKLDISLEFPRIKSVRESYEFLIEHKYFIKEFIKYYELVEEKDLPDIDYNFTENKTFGIDETVTLAEEFFLSLDEPFSSLFLSINKYADVKFINFRKDVASVHYPRGNEKLTMYVPLTNDFETLINYVHESAHVVEYICNPYKQDYKEFYNEVFTIFFEFVVLDFLKEKNIDESRLNAYFNYLVNYFDEVVHNFISIVQSIMKIYGNIPDNNYKLLLEFKKLNIEIYRAFHMDKKTIEGLLLLCNSYYVAYEIYNVYLEDKEKALEIFIDFFKYRPTSYEDMEEFFNSRGIKKEKAFVRIKSSLVNLESVK